MAESRFAIVKESNFWILLFSRLAASLADWVLIFSLLVWAEERTGSTFLGGFIFGSKLIMTFVSEIFAGVYADRVKRKSLMIASDFARAGLIALFVFFNVMADVNLVFVLVAAFTIIGSFYAAASAAIIPQAISSENWTSANLFFSLSLVGTIAIGPPLTSILLSFFSLDIVFFITIFTLVLSGTVLFSLKLKYEFVPLAKKNVFREIMEGVKYLVNSRRLKGMLMSVFPTALGVGPLLVLMPSLLTNEIGLSQALATSMFVFLGLGLLVGLVAMELAGKKRAVGMVFMAGLVCAGSAVVLLSTAANYVFVAIVATIAGAGIIVVYATIMTVLQSVVDDRYMGRVIMTLFGLGSVVGGVASGLFGYVAHAIGVRASLAIAGGLIIAGALVFLVRMPSDLRATKVVDLAGLKKPPPLSP